jgi:DNA-binding MarR family transcriptional regulator
MSNERNLANKLLEVVPTLMHQLRGEVRAVYRDSLTIPQFRVLTNIRRGIQHVSQIAEDHGVSQPAMSKMVEALVKRGLVKRLQQSTDRRQIKLQLTAKGVALMRGVRKASAEHLSRRFKNLNADRLRRLTEALEDIETLLLNRGGK